MFLETGKAHIQKLRAAFNAAPHRGQEAEYIKDKLRHMVDIDQYVIELGMNHGAYLENRNADQEKLHGLIQSVVREHSDSLKAILKTHDWDAIKKMGGHAADHAFLLVQHADHDPTFQADVLKTMETSGDAKTMSYAYLYDRVAMNTGRPQRYGTQFTKATQPYIIEDPEGLDERRNQVGLMCMTEYTKEMTRQHAAAQIPKP